MPAIVSTYKVTVTTAGVNIVSPKGDVNPYDVLIVPDAGVTVFIGEQGAENFVVPSSGISLSDVHRYENEEPWDLSRVYLKADGAAGDVSILLTEVIDGR